MTDTLRLIDRQSVARDTTEFRFEKPAGFSFTAGQNINIKLSQLLHEDKRGPRRTFTLSSAPYEDYLSVTTRMTGSGFKKTLAELPLGTEVEFMGPKGEFSLQARWKQAVLIAGGIGITPFRSMILQSLYEKQDYLLTLLYSNKDAGSCAYHDLLTRIANESSTVRYVPTFTDSPANHEWNGEKRKIDVDFIQDYVSDFRTAIFYLCGPPAMVEELTASLTEADINPENVLAESFWGY